MGADHRSHSSVDYTSRTNTTIPAPSGIQDADNLVILFVIGAASAVLVPIPSPPDGFESVDDEAFPTSVSQGNNSADFTVRTYCWRKIANGESGDYVVTHDTGTSAAYMVAVEGGELGETLTVTPSVALGMGNTPISVDGITTTEDDSWIGFFAHNWRQFGGHSPPEGTAPTFTERLDSANNLIYAADGVLASAGATTDPVTKASGHESSDDQWVGVLLAIQAAPPDETAPTLTNPDIAATSDVEAEGSFDVNEPCTWAAVLTTSATEPDPEEVEAGEDHNGDPAVATDSGSTSAGTVPVSFAGLIAETTYHGYAVARDTAGNLSTVLYLGSLVTEPPDEGGVVEGEVVIDGVPVEGARVFLIDTQSDPIFTIDTFTDEYGVYRFAGLARDGRKYHATVEYEDSGTLYSARAQPFLEPEE